MNEWILGIELNGEWECCSFPDRQQALYAFSDLRFDYPRELERAVLVRVPLRRASATVIAPSALIQ